MKKFDAHAHIGFSGEWAQVGITEEELIAQMDQYEIEVTALCCEDNEETLRALKNHPDRFLGCCFVDPFRQPAVEMIERYAAQGFSAIKLHPLCHAYCADSTTLDPVMEAAARLDLPVCIHSGHPPYSLPWQIALLAERHPSVRILMLHMGHGHGVYIDGTLKMARRFPNLYLEMSGMPMPSKIREAYETVGEDRIFFGTDAPFHDPSVEILKVDVCGVDEAARQKIFYDNAAAFFRR